MVWYVWNFWYVWNSTLSNWKFLPLTPVLCTCQQPQSDFAQPKRIIELPYLRLANHGLAIVILRLLVRARVRSSLAVGNLLVRSIVTLLRLAGVHRVTGWHPLYNA
jgi:hypothetical protein